MSRHPNRDETLKAESNFRRQQREERFERAAKRVMDGAGVHEAARLMRVDSRALKAWLRGEL